MGELVAERVRRYVLDGSDEDLRRLLRISQVTSEAARAAFRRVGAREGWRAIDCGCGPIGALAEMSDIVGPAGRAVGVDFSEAAIRRARSVIEALGLENVEVLVGDIYDIEPATLGDDFDMALTRCFLMHQPDPVRALSQVATLIRPGGWIIAHEPLPAPPPRSFPQLDALARYWEVVHETMVLGGAAPRAVEDLPRSARAAGLEVVEMSGFFKMVAPQLGFDLHAATAAAVRERAVSLGIAAEKIDDLVQELRSATDDNYEWVSSPFYFDLALRKPAT
ncbi:MAG TPA: class I SAM-dependent methyltransferase [Acidimicrobiales bacterium]|nr:class I SAM-dependent methyltransferase [Acidimicrobiales bacterium]